MDMFCWILNLFQYSLSTLDVNLVFQSEMNFFGAPYLEKTCCMINAATPSTVIDSLQGMRIITLEQLWSVMVRIISYPPDWGNFMMKSMAMVWNGSNVAQHTAQHTGDLVSPCIREPSVG